MRNVVLVRRFRSLQFPLRRHFTAQHSSFQRNAPAESSPYERLVTRTPRLLRPTLKALHNAPVTHITAFLILHEITAIVPLLGLAGVFHYYNWLPQHFAEGAWIAAGVEKFGRYFKRKGWIGAVEEAEAEREAMAGMSVDDIEKTRESIMWNKGQGGTRLVLEFATAYAITKALLPLRLVLSVWGAPWFARWTVVPIGNVLRRLFGKKAVS